MGTTSSAKALSNARNGRKSNGAKTAAGKLTIVRARTTNGIQSRLPVLAGIEDPVECEKFHQGFTAAWQPVGTHEAECVRHLAHCYWRLRRATRFESEATMAELLAQARYEDTERATAWLLAHKILLPGSSTLERFVVRLRSRVETRLWRLLGRGITAEQRKRLEQLLIVPEGSRGSWLDELRSGPTRVSGPALRAAIERLKSVRELGITLPAAARIPQSRIAALARFASRAKVTLITRMPPTRRLATLAAFVHGLEATAQDDALEVLELLLHELFDEAEKADQRARLRTLKDLDGAAATLADVGRVVLDPALPDNGIRRRIFETIPQPLLQRAVQNVDALIRPPEDVFYKELDARYAAVRRYLPAVLKHVRFEANPAGKPVVAAYDWLRDSLQGAKPAKGAPQEVITTAWQRHVFRKDRTLDLHAYTFCVLDQLLTALRRRDAFAKPSWRYADPRANLLGESEWEAMRPIVCRTLGLSAQPQPVLDALRAELD